MILIYTDETIDKDLTAEQTEPMLVEHHALQRKYEATGGLLATAKLKPTETAVSIKERLVDDTDGPYAESKEQFIGFYLLKCDSIEEAIDAAKILPSSHHRYEVRPVDWFGGHAARP